MLKLSPAAWTIALKYMGEGLDASGVIAIEEDGNVWATNNFLFGLQPDLTDCSIGRIGATKLAPDGFSLSPAWLHGWRDRRRGVGSRGRPEGEHMDKELSGDSVSLLTPGRDSVFSRRTDYKANGNTSKVQETVVD